MKTALLMALQGLLIQASGPTVLTERFFEQKLNPADVADVRTFQQRYYIHSAHARGRQAPVVFYICGESECLPRSFIGRFAEDVATKLGAHLVALEHRYYGVSHPFDSLTPDNLKYLSTDNAIEDLARFQTYAMNVLGLKGKWVAIGGSYPGSLAAYYRLKHPELVVGALASSAPVQAKNSFVEYDSHVTQVLGPLCGGMLRQVDAAAEKAIQNPEDFGKFKELFGASEVQDDGDFLYVLADVTAFAVQYGSSVPMCQRLLAAGDPVVAYASYVRGFLESMGMTAAQFSPQSAADQSLQGSDGMRQWLYQSCTEYGYWQDAHPDASKSVRSARINAEYDRGICRRFYGITELADESVINRKYYEPLLDASVASRIFFTNGSEDPWSELSITHERGNDVNAQTGTFMIQGKAHCSDLKASRDDDPDSLREARRIFTDLASSWISN